MPAVFQFSQGSESRRFNPDSSPLLGRFRAVPPRPGLPRSRPSQLGLLSTHAGYGSVLDLGDDEGSDDDSELEDELLAMEGVGKLGIWWRKGVRRVFDLWIEPRQAAVKKVVDIWWSRYGVLVLMPASLAVVWCAVPFPQYPLPDEDHDGYPDDPDAGNVGGHGAARVRVNFWFFLIFYYGLYNLTALMWITKVFNLYSLNWWPRSLGLPVTVCLIALVGTAVPIPLYFRPETRFLTAHNTSWICWTFIIMAIPVVIAFLILMLNERHIGLRNTLSETQRIFTTSWWTGEADTFSHRERRRPALQPDSFDPDLIQVAEPPRPRRRVTIDRDWLPASFVRFIWFCLVLFVALTAYVIGEAYAEIYLRTLPHNSFETVVYVYSWVVTIHILDVLTGFILGIREGQRVGSYPLSWVFKLYFQLTYQTYVRALYARLRSPQQFFVLQVLSSTTIIIVMPTLMSATYHRLLSALHLTTLSYPTYQKLCTRNVFIRFIAENASMATFLGAVLVLHFGANKDVYPYFAFDADNEPYDFNLTFYASSVTWACELAAALAVRLLIKYFYGVNVDLEGKLDLAVWPELLPASAVVILHVLQNMLFSIIRLQFH